MPVVAVVRGTARGIPFTKLEFPGQTTRTVILPPARDPRLRLRAEEMNDLPTVERDNAAEARAARERLFARIAAAMALPPACRRLLACDGDSASSEEWIDAIASDPVLAPRLLRRLHSPYFGLSQKVSDVESAIRLLGWREFSTLALTVFLSRLYRGTGSYGAYRREQLWSHSVAVAAVARLVSRVTGRAAPAEAFVAGLLHDLGLVLIDRTLPRHFTHILDLLTPETPTCDVECRVLSFDHAELGGFVARQWGFPDGIAAAVSFHHQPLACEGSHRSLVHVIAMANYLCTRAGNASLGVGNVGSPPDEVTRTLGLDQVTLTILCAELDATLQKSEALARA